MNCLSPEQVLFLHARLIEETGGSHGMRDLALLESAVNRPRSTSAGRELYPDPVSKAAALMDALIRNHPFVDGNRRSGIAAAALFLVQNDHRLTAPNAEVEAFVLHVVKAEPDVAEIARWLQAHSIHTE